MSLEHIHPQGMAPTTNYTSVVVGTGRVIFVSGQVSLDEAGNVVGAGDLAAQADQVFDNLKKCLAAAGASLADVTKLTTYVVNYQPEHRPIIAGARAKHLGAGPFPASTLVGVQALALPEFLIEIEAMAVLS